MKRAVIVSALRTPIGKFLGCYKKVSAVELGIHSVKAALSDCGINPREVDEVIYGNARQAGSGPNPARQISIKAGIPDSVPAYTINKACGSGLKSIILATQSIALGKANIVVVGGTENMTKVPFMSDQMRFGSRLGDIQFDDGMYRDGFFCPISELLMGETAENIAQKYSISRSEQDEYAVLSQNRCENARKKGFYKDELIDVIIKDKKGEKTITSDEHPRDGVTVEKLAKLPPVFKKDGTVHAGNSSGITDGAATLIVMSEEKASDLGLKPLAYCGEYSIVGVDPKFMGMGPVPATMNLLKLTGNSLDDYDLIELNEAFAAQVLGCMKEVDFPLDRTNVNGGSIALGHPIGCTGARFVVTLLNEMKRRNAKTGLATLCISGGLGIAMEFTSK